MSFTSPIERGDAIRPGDPPTVNRYRLGARVNHWITALAMVLLVLSGLAMFHPSLFFLSAIFGGGQNVRAFHPWFGIVLFLSFLFLFIQFCRANLWDRSDWDWLMHIRDLLAGHEEKMPPVGKYNAGQKFVFWSMAFFILVLLGSGVVIWDEYFFGLTTIESKRYAVLTHSIAAIVTILLLILHVYAAIWVRGSFDAMIKGSVPVGWAWLHHRRWYQRLVERSGRTT
jgi:formate dehydrogenase subunit gamma